MIEAKRGVAKAGLAQQEGGRMAKWIFEPGHTAAEFSVRHMMVTFVRGHFKNVHGALEFDPDRPEQGSVQVEINAAELWTGEPERDDHLRSDHFLDVANHPKITFKSARVERVAGNEGKVTGDLMIRGVTRPVTLEVRYHGRWKTPFNDTRAGFSATTKINRLDFGVSWNAEMESGGIVVGNDVLITIDAEAILQTD